MKKRLLRAALCTLPPMLLCMAVRLLPDFAARWSAWVARPMLQTIALIGGRLPFPLMEWGVLALLVALCIGFIYRLCRRGVLHAAVCTLKRICLLLMALVWLLAALWYPLYFAEAPLRITVTSAQLAASCRTLIDDLNADSLDFSEVPDDLPAKYAAFPGWMQVLNLAGFAPFLTGEALISPELPNAAVPFVAVHESMHTLGHADEGRTNLAAWAECLRRGRVYADSARLWALKDSLELLRRMDSDAWSSIRSELPPQLEQLLTQLGGETAPPGDAALAVLAPLGLAESVQNYEILALYLAAEMPI
ncbi:MAG: DUF3810 family protein [Eubacteriales bacterium]|nr:DUF3810 family protein [Eubacteriales bacterium]